MKQLALILLEWYTVFIKLSKVYMEKPFNEHRLLFFCEISALFISHIVCVSIMLAGIVYLLNSLYMKCPVYCLENDKKIFALLNMEHFLRR